MAEINVLMFGARRTGKSSVLASMIDSFEAVTKSSTNKIKLEATEATEDLLNKKRGLLKSIFNQKKIGEAWPIDEDPTPSDYTYEFNISAEGSSQTHKLRFKDIPGEWLMTEERVKDVDNNLTISQIIIIAIDTPHLMEEEGDFSGSFNITNQINDYFQVIKMDASVPRMILFVPVKCEKYYHEGKMDEVNRRIKEEYSILLKSLMTEKTKELYTIAITPILTLGGVVFHDFLRGPEGFVEIIDDPRNPSLAYRPKMTFYKLYEPNPVFAPKYCEQPVLYILNFILKVEGFSTTEVRHIGMGKRVANAISRFICPPIPIIYNPFFEMYHIKKAWDELLNDTEFIKGSLKTTMENVKRNGDGYEVLQEPTYIRSEQ